MSALGSAIGSRISDGCQSAQMGTCQLESVAVGDRTCASAEYFDHTGKEGSDVHSGNGKSGFHVSSHVSCHNQ